MALDEIVKDLQRALDNLRRVIGKAQQLLRDLQMALDDLERASSPKKLLEVSGTPELTMLGS